MPEASGYTKPEPEPEVVGACQRPEFVALSGLTVNLATVGPLFSATLDSAEEVLVGGALLQFEQYDSVGVFGVPQDLSTLWRSGLFRAGETPIGDVLLIDILSTTVRAGNRTTATDRQALYSGVRTPEFTAAWQALMVAIQACLADCCGDGDGLCGSAPVVAVILAAERLHEVLGRTVTEFHIQSAKELSCGLEEALAILVCEAVSTASGYRGSLIDTLAWLDVLLRRPPRDRFATVAVAQALGPIFEFVSNPVVDDTDESRTIYRQAVQAGAVLLGNAPAATPAQPAAARPHSALVGRRG